MNDTLKDIIGNNDDAPKELTDEIVKEIELIHKWASNGEPIDHTQIKALTKTRAAKHYELTLYLNDRWLGRIS